MNVGRGRAVPSVLLAALLVSGCGGADDRAVAAADVVSAFGAALAAGDGVAACGLLATATAQQLDTGEEICASTIVDAGLPTVGEVLSATVFGDAAQVRARGDVLFLTLVDDHWAITAAGCTFRPDDRPYDCVLEG